ncbi:hypothetical protein ACFLXH_04700 [Chloroflexota bacterium]
MYKEHPSFKKPESNKTKIWRYIDFTKFVSVLAKQQLFFARSDKLGDPFEGSYPTKNVEQRKLNHTKLLKSLPPHIKIMIEGRPQAISEFHKNIRKFIFISGWHKNKNESAAMRNLYLKSNEGIAIQSTFACLRDSFIAKTPDIYIGEVEYRDYFNQKISENNFFSPFLHKRSSFEHEQELRAIILTYNKTKENLPNFKNPPSQDGISVPVDLGKLIQNIYVAPTSPKWFVELVKSVSKKYGLAKPVIQSELDKKPAY